ncbi:transposase [Candidatus Heimdallarchaeota archaeon B3_Heim]|nr:MAG: transposase [Candidatus Heimdallarchaeota archaeon B3_Heim]
MSKNTEIKFVGQPIFKQIVNLVDAVNIQGLIKKHNSDHYYKAFKSKIHLITMLFGILSRCDSMTEICEGLRALGGKLNHLGLEKAPAKSTACDGLRKRNNIFFEDLYFSLVKKYQSFLSDSRTFGLTFKEVLLIDSTTIRLFSDILKGVGRNPKGDGKKKGGLKVHMLIDAVQSVGRFIKITAAKVHDKNFLKSLELISHSMIVFDKAYNYYHQFALWIQKQVFFVTRLKKGAVYTVVEVTRKHYRKKGIAKVLSDEIIELEYHPEDETGKKQTKVKKKLRLRKVCYQDERNRYYEFLANNFEITAEEVAFLYKKRWGIEILFKKMKQNFQLHYFYGENENAIRTQVWCTLIAQLLLTVIQKIAQTKKAFSVVAS